MKAEEAMHKQSLSGAWQFRQAGSDTPGPSAEAGAGWLPAQVPGGVHSDLLATGRIPDPFAGDNEKRVAWVAEAGWEYRRTFEVTAGLLNMDQVWLVCDGLDTLATVTLNGHVLGQTDNMFRQYRWGVKDLLQQGDANELRIVFASPVQSVTARQAERPLPGVSQAIPGGPHLRKAPCQFGWDWGPQLPPIGIWRDLRLEGYTKARLEEVHLRQRHVEGRVTVEARIVVERWGTTELAAEVHIVGPDGARYGGRAAFPDGSTHSPSVPPARSDASRDRLPAPEGTREEPLAPGSPTGGFTGSPAGGEVTVEVAIDRPQLWWPNGYGGQPQYRIEVELRPAGAAEGSTVEVLDRRTYQIGLRTVELRQQPDRWGKSFVFVVNGQPIFAKGSNWIPADAFPTRVSNAHLESLIRAAAETHHNMLRVWGGGIYEEERFYDLCDRYGILVWQEFIYACSVYPLDDPEFVENVRHESIENIRRLRHRASLAVWCGNNEMEWGWCDWGWDRPARSGLKAAYEQFFHHTLPAWCTAEDPDHPYWPSSPSSDTPFQDPNGQQQGDAHYWDVWHGRKPFTAYRDQYPRFMSEFGFQALPPLATIRTYAEESEWNMTSYIMEQHQKNASGNGLMLGQMAENYRMPKDFPALVYMTLVQQAEGIRYGVEHWRRHMDRVAGTLYWQLNDCWPVASWSSLDYFGRWKALHYAARRFYAPLLLSIEDSPPVQAIHVTSDLGEPWHGTARWWLETLDGAVLASGEAAVEAGPHASTHVCTLDFSDRVGEANRREVVFVTELLQGADRVALLTAGFVPPKHLALREPGITAGVSGEGNIVWLRLRARSLARLVEVALAGADVVFSDNYFDLPAGREVTVTGALPEGWGAEEARKALQVRSLYNAYA